MDFDFNIPLTIDGRSLAAVRGVATLEPNNDTPDAKTATVPPFTIAALTIWTTRAGGTAETLTPMPDTHWLYDRILIAILQDRAIADEWAMRMSAAIAAAPQKFRSSPPRAPLRVVRPDSIP